ncbi:hypothetical protein ACJMK2_037897 [Sinanodonta woodiana]|uniref:MADS-box domain-containing protein n=1 Tax=Sinanodonta woodiana TaxID=1069815 RepID=A0ABD3WQD7_SINWO
MEDTKHIHQTFPNHMDLINGSHITNQPAFPNPPTSFGNKMLTLEQVDPSTLVDEDDSDEDGKVLNTGLKPGKKTKGRVKIKMEFIENKLRRYTTFSKRKTGIMKKAYELSTLTGTQVMLLVASETGHVYTFATRKLQPMITSESGKALIQTCLNSPDPPPMAPGQQQAIEQRMNPGGYEEPELTYAVSEDETKSMESVLKPMFTLSGISPSDGHTQTTVVPHQMQLSSASPTTYVQPISVAASSLTTNTTSTTSSQITNQTKQTAGVHMQLQGLPGGIIIQQGTPIAIPIQATTNGQVNQSNSNQHQQTVYRLPSSQPVIATSTQGTTTLTPSVVMYQTPQGIVYAPATASIQDRQIFNFQQPATAFSMPQTDQQGQQQMITIPVPVSLTGSPQVLFTSATEQALISDLSQPSAAKKTKKS